MDRLIEIGYDPRKDPEYDGTGRVRLYTDEDCEELIERLKKSLPDRL